MDDDMEFSDCEDKLEVWVEVGERGGEVDGKDVRSRRDCMPIDGPAFGCELSQEESRMLCGSR